MNTARAKPKAYLVIETEVRDHAALAIYAPRARAAIEGAGGRTVASVGGKTISFVGDAPERIGIIEWESLEKAQEWRGSIAFRNLVPLREKAVKTIRVCVIGGAAN